MKILIRWRFYVAQKKKLEIVSQTKTWGHVCKIHRGLLLQSSILWSRFRMLLFYKDLLMQIFRRPKLETLGSNFPSKPEKKNPQISIGYNGVIVFEQFGRRLRDPVGGEIQAEQGGGYRRERRCCLEASSHRSRRKHAQSYPRREFFTTPLLNCTQELGFVSYLEFLV